MFRLYKRDEETGRPIAYHEVWVELKPRRIIEHWGMLGERGDTITHRIKLLQSLEKQIDAFLDPARALGFSEVEERDYAALVIEYTLGEAWEAEDDEKIRAAEDALTEILGWTGLGRCDGETLSEETLTLNCRVLDTDMAQEQIVEQLKGTEFADYSRIYEE